MRQRCPVQTCQITPLLCLPKTDQACSPVHGFPRAILWAEDTCSLAIHMACSLPPLGLYSNFISARLSPAVPFNIPTRSLYMPLPRIIFFHCTYHHLTTLYILFTYFHCLSPLCFLRANSLSVLYLRK